MAYTVPYKLSPSEAQLYKAVTDYVRDEFDRAEALQNDKRAGTVGFALTILQRRLASSPEAIYQSLRRRRERLESRLRELELLQRGGQAVPALILTEPILDEEDVQDLEDAPDHEVEQAEEHILDQATAARTIAELKADIATLKNLETLALSVRRSGADTKWRELASLFGEIFTSAALAEHVAEASPPYGKGGIAQPTASARQKLVIFTEHRDTLNYLEHQAARDEIWQSWRRACADNADHPRAKELFNRNTLPAFHDPFAGGGALPLEAQRLGLEAYASDLNPVAVLINKAMIEILPKFAGKSRSIQKVGNSG